MYILLKNMFDPSEETEKNWHKDMADDVRLECEKYGNIKEIYVDKLNPSGQIYLKSKDSRHARKVCDALNGRYFEGRKVVGQFLREADYKEAVAKLKY